MTPRHKLTLIDYGEEDAEVTWGISGKKEGKKTQKRGESKNREANLDRCIRRAKAKLRRKVMSAGLDHLLTLTYKENVTERWKAWADFERFVRVVHKHRGDWPWVVVAEAQKRGAVHFHLAVKGFQNVELLRGLWRSIIGEGNIDVQYKRSPAGVQWKKSALASYLTKYIGKNMETDLNEKRFRCSLGIEIKGQVIWVPLRVPAKDYALFRLEAAAGRVGYVWCREESNGQYGWACSW